MLNKPTTTYLVSSHDPEIGPDKLGLFYSYEDALAFIAVLLEFIDRAFFGMDDSEAQNILYLCYPALDARTIFMIERVHADD